MPQANPAIGREGRQQIAFGGYGRAVVDALVLLSQAAQQTVAQLVVVTPGKVSAFGRTKFLILQSLDGLNRVGLNQAGGARN